MQLNTRRWCVGVLKVVLLHVYVCKCTHAMLYLLSCASNTCTPNSIARRTSSASASLAWPRVHVSAVRGSLQEGMRRCLSLARRLTYERWFEALTTHRLAEEAAYARTGSFDQRCR